MPATNDTLKKLAVLIIAVSILQGCGGQKDDAAGSKSRSDSAKPEDSPDATAADATATDEAARDDHPSPKTAPDKAPKKFSYKMEPPKPVEARPYPTALPKLDRGERVPLYPGARRDDDPTRSIATAAAEDDPALKHEQPGYTTVKIFYGTDREAEVERPWTKLGTVPWGYLMAAAGAFCMLMLIVAAVGKNRYVAVVFVLGVVATTALFFCVLLIPRNTKPRQTHLARTYGNERGTLEVGTCEVSIPEEHKMGEVERPSIFRFEFNEDPTLHVVLLAVDPRPADKFFAELKSDISQSAARQTFVFIHGFNVTFEGAALRTAQLKYDLEFDGAAVFYSWPSQGGLLDYIADETNAGWTVAHLEEFITDIARQSGAKQIHLIAHSMGNRALTGALQRLSRKLKPEELPMFNEVVLTAPDIDADVFRRDIAPAIVKTARRVTLYASSNDGALAASKKIHGYPRAGESGENVVVVDGIDTIDVSGIDTSLLGHTYYGDNDTVITDIVQLLRESKPPRLRDRLRETIRNGQRYWVFFTKDKPDS